MEKEFDCIKLHFSSPLHLSRGREQFDESAKTLHSDTIASALFVSALHLGASEKDALDMLDACRLSSAFPFAGSEFFFPKPMARLPFSILGEPEEKQAKPMKKIQFLGKSWFEKVLHNESATIDSDLNLKADKSFLSSLYGGKVTMSNVTQRVTIQPDHIEDSKPFFTERLHFNEQAGLFFLIEWENSAIKDLFYSAIRLLGDLGIGTDRAVGNGFFTPESTTLRMRLPEVTTHQCALGLYLPKEHELSNSDIEQSAWAITKRGGYMAGASDADHITLRKRSVYMFEVGSIFPNKKLVGKRVDLRPDWNEPMHPVWRVGKPVFVPISSNNR